MTLYRFRARARACAGAAFRAGLVASGLLSAGPVASAETGASEARSSETPLAAPARRLDLRVGDMRRHVPRQDLLAPWTSELDEVVIRPRRQPPDLPERRAVPQGLGGLFWAASNPLQSWRLFVPDPNAPPVQARSPDDPREPPGAHRSRIGEPGRIF